MTGLQIFNDQGIEIINSNDPMPFVFAKGTVLSQPDNSYRGWQQIVNYSGWPEPPVVLIRPRSSSNYYGGFRIRYISPTQFAFTVGGTTFDWVACASARSAGLVPPANGYGIEVYDENGNLTFSSAMQFPRIITIQAIKAPYTTSGGSLVNTSATIGANFTSMPWLNLADVKTSLPFPANVDGASYEAFSVNVSADFKTLRARLSDTLVAQYNQYQNSNMHIPMCVIPGT